MIAATGLIRSRWLDCIAAAPPILIIIAFKIYISRTLENQFRYYNPTQQELEQERMYSMSEKRTKHSEMEKRFLHPALQQDKLYTIMVHKSQEQLAREVLSAYPWFAGKHQHDGVEIKAVREVSIIGRILHEWSADILLSIGKPRVRPQPRRTCGCCPSSRLGCSIDRFYGNARWIWWWEERAIFDCTFPRC